MGEPIVVFPLQSESLQGIQLDTQPALRALMNTHSLLAVGLALIVAMAIARLFILMPRKLDCFELHLKPNGLHLPFVELGIVLDPARSRVGRRKITLRTVDVWNSRRNRVGKTLGIVQEQLISFPLGSSTVKADRNHHRNIPNIIW
jgi:hypothetical protein